MNKKELIKRIESFDKLPAEEQLNTFIKRGMYTVYKNEVLTDTDKAIVRTKFNQYRIKHLYDNCECSKEKLMQLLKD